ncbi:MAG: hypothetical protein AAFU41_04050 [Pseudomonadota bacterium]
MRDIAGRFSQEDFAILTIAAVGFCHSQREFKAGVDHVKRSSSDKNTDRGPGSTAHLADNA